MLIIEPKHLIYTFWIVPNNEPTVKRIVDKFPKENLINTMNSYYNYSLFKYIYKNK